ncbi:hypothetical protein NBH20_08575 [Rhizobium sp. S153]|uniref:Acetyl-CoA carboxylase biotin carboxyl carrier protein subunit n=1 Tax=Ciceribacter sichuanensis TaxID=2949647 RepID=A0ABT0V5T1_9HYPH|nr:hypothetical protein [Ciceribacter sp. S153]MCM2401207.1 hypothetical protein [Ciceribacter sp. S153]
MNDAWLKSVLRLLEQYGIAEFEYEDDTRHILASNGRTSEIGRVRHEEPTPPRQTIEIPAPFIGIFRSAHPDTREPTELPRLVRKGEIIGYLRIEMLLRPVLAPQDGVLAEQLVGDGALADYGKPLFRFHPAGR